MDDTPQDREAKGLVFLRRLVTGLTLTMIVGLVILIVLFVTRFPTRQDAPAEVPLPESIALPDGTRATAFTRGPDWFAVVTDDDRILILDAATGALRQTVTID